MDKYSELQALLERVRRRWMAIAGLRAYSRAAAAATAVLVAVLSAVLIVNPAGIALLAVASLAAAIVVGCFVWVGWSLRHRPDDLRVARFIEEQCPQLEDRVATAVQFGSRGDGAASGTLLAPMLADAVRSVRTLNFDSIVSMDALKRAAAIAAGTSAIFGAALYLSRTPGRQALAVASMYAFPSRVTFDVSPGDARIRAGQPLRVTVRVTGAEDAIAPSLNIQGQSARALQAAGKPNEFTAVIEAVSAPFTYAVSAGAASSRVFTVSVMRAPRVARIDLQYEYPAAFGLAARAEQDSGDIYAPVGTSVRMRVQADKAVRSAELVMADGSRVKLGAIGPDVVGGEIKVAEDGSYRVALVDDDGLDNPGETEYFIRTLDDRPPDVRILSPAGDRHVTRLEEVEIEARAEDDYGIRQFELVYSVRGGVEKAVPFRNGRPGLSVTGSRTLYLEDLDVQPGDFVTYYARARDVSRGKRSTEARSDIFFLEVKPFGEEFTAAQSNAQGAGGGGRPLDDLAAAQKEIIIATWKLDRRSQGGKSEQDIQSVARAQHELRRRAEQAAGESRAFTNRRRSMRPGQTEPAGPADDPMTRAVAAMTKAAGQLDALNTSAALPHEMAALNELLKAESENRRRQVARQQGGGMGTNRPTQDLSSLFDRELQRQQQTNYETPTSSETRGDSKDSAVDKIRELARRQDELSRQQQDLAKQKTQLSADELKRQLERLTREQSELRRQAEELSRQLAQQQKSTSSQSQSQSGQGQGQGGQGSQQKTASQGGGQSMRDISEEMRNAANDLRREDPQQASASSSKALQGLRDLERQLQTAQPDARQRRLGDLGLEARQLADAERQIASELSRVGKSGTPSGDALRRLAGEKERLADRVDKLQNSVKQLAGADRANGRDAGAVGAVDTELERQRLPQRMRDSASAIRAAAGDSHGAASGAAGALDPARQSAVEQDLARALDRVAEKIGSASGAQNADARRLSDRLAETRDARDRLSEVERKLDDKQRELAAASQKGGRSSSTPRPGSPPNGQAQGGRQAGGQNGSGPKAQGDQQSKGSGAPGGSATQGEVARLQEEYGRLYRQARELIDQLRRDNPQAGAGGYTPTRPDERVEAAGGVEGYQQDYAKWDALRKDINLALEQIENSLSEQLKDKETRDRLNAGANGSAPETYRRMVEKYFQSIASRKKP